ncbi:hypothetical protein TNCV_3004511 [Trichonephila clavipes]|nr:hypothetical protein TNCV_3004511 [Trichonephila clavipes]
MVKWRGRHLSPLLTTTPHQLEDLCVLDRFNVHRVLTRWIFSGTGLELVTCHPRSDTLTTRLPRPRYERDGPHNLELRSIDENDFKTGSSLFYKLSSPLRHLEFLSFYRFNKYHSLYMLD